tara:strand:- start:597 stop:1370 length:774 start_codon:yes stop_codon:yes gene_type:complete
MATELKALALADTETMTQLAPTRRPSDAFAWVGGHHSEQRFGEHIVRTNYRLSELEAAGLLDSEAVAQFRKQTGCADFGWSMYARDELLGPLSAPAALARAKHTTVFLHGLFTNREIWKDVAIGTSRDNGLAVVLTPDLPGFGESRLGKQIPREVLSPKGMIHSVNAWLALIGIGDIPKVVMGHSYSAAALIASPKKNSAIECTQSVSHRPSSISHDVCDLRLARMRFLRDFSLPYPNGLLAALLVFYFDATQPYCS